MTTIGLASVSLATATWFGTRSGSTAPGHADESRGWRPPSRGLGPIRSRLIVVAVALSFLHVSMSDRAKADPEHASRPHHVRAPSGGSRHTGRGVPRDTPTSQDAVELATLSPRANASTTAQTYGDAAYARAHLQRSIAREEAMAPSRPEDPASSCDPRTTTASGYICDIEPRGGRDRQGYAFTPSYLSAPQRIAVPADVQTPFLSPLSGLAWIVDSLRYKPRD